VNGRDGCSSPPAGLQVPTEALDIETVHLEEAALMVRAPHRELSQIHGIRLACRASIARRESSERQPFAIGEAPIDGNKSNRSIRIHRGPPRSRAEAADSGATLPQPIVCGDDGTHKW
jgi:hypothetical protein